MCSAFWNLEVPALICPYCGGKVCENLQTHFRGEIGDCLQNYHIDEKIPNLIGLTGRLAEMGDSLCSVCEDCNHYLDYDAVIRKGIIIGVEFLPDEKYEKHIRKRERKKVKSK